MTTPRRLPIITSSLSPTGEPEICLDWGLGWLVHVACTESPARSEAKPQWVRPTGVEPKLPSTMIWRNVLSGSPL